MSKLQQLAEKLLAEFAKPKGEWLDQLHDGERINLRGFISTDDRRQIVLSKEMEQSIRDIATELRKQNRDLSLSHTDKEWIAQVRSTVGSLLGKIDLAANNADNAKVIVDTLKEKIDKLLPSGRCEHTYGCTLFEASDIKQFSIGPVTFEPRVDWLKRKVYEGSISKISARRIEASWSGKKLSNRKSSDDFSVEKDAIRAVGHCSYVCSIKTYGLAYEAGRQKAQMAAHMALAAVALKWEIPSKALSGFRLAADAEDRLQTDLVFKTGSRPSGGFIRVGMPFGPSVSAEQWLQMYDNYKELDEVIGQAIEYFLSPSGASSRPKFMHMLMQAIFWFYEGCRDEVDLMSIVKFTATLEALTITGKSSGIKRMINSRLGIKNDQTLWPAGPTLKDAVDEIYSKGRSRTLHGSNDWFAHDWSSRRMTAESLARHCLVSSIIWMSENNAVDDPKALLS